MYALAGEARTPDEATQQAAAKALKILRSEESEETALLEPVSEAPGRLTDFHLNLGVVGIAFLQNLCSNPQTYHQQTYSFFFCSLSWSPRMSGQSIPQPG